MYDGIRMERDAAGAPLYMSLFSSKRAAGFPYNYEE